MNHYLKDKQYKIPLNILKSIEIAKASTSNRNGLKRANFMLKNGYLTYQAMKRLKNFFDYFNPQTDDQNQFVLAGGQSMKAFIETSLNADRNAVKTGKEVRRDITPNTNSELKPYQIPRLNEEKKLEKIAGLINKLEKKDIDKLINLLERKNG